MLALPQQVVDKRQRNLRISRCRGDWRIRPLPAASSHCSPDPPRLVLDPTSSKGRTRPWASAGRDQQPSREAASGSCSNCCATATASSPPAWDGPAARTTTRPRRTIPATQRRSRWSSIRSGSPIGAYSSTSSWSIDPTSARISSDPAIAPRSSMRPMSSAGSPSRRSPTSTPRTTGPARSRPRSARPLASGRPCLPIRTTFSANVK